MKKICIFILAVILTISAVGCTSTEKPQGNQPNAERPSTHFSSLDEIAAFAKSKDAPKGFVRYEAISILGEFNNYLVFTRNYSRYQYTLVDQKQFNFKLEVRHDDFDKPDVLLNETDNMANMATIGTDQTGWIVRGKLMYWYGKGDLLSIVIPIDNVQICLTYVDLFQEYPVDENGELTTFIERLVFGTEDEAQAATDEFIAFFRKNR